MPQVTFADGPNGERIVQEGRQQYTIEQGQESAVVFLSPTENWLAMTNMTSVKIPNGVDGIGVLKRQLENSPSDRFKSFAEIKADFKDNVNINDRISSVETDNKFAGLVEGAGKLVDKLPTGTTMASNTIPNVTVDEPSKGRLA